MKTIDLTKYGITGTTEIVYNPSYEMLFEEETKPELEGYEKGQVSELGAVNVMTGIYTGRSPKDKFIVMDETFDMWRKKKTRHDYSRYFNEWHERDLTDLIVRDRNHPSIFMWSIGNEVLEQWTDAKADTLSLEEANLVLNFGHSADMLAKDGEMSVNSLLTI